MSRHYNAKYGSGKGWRYSASSVRRDMSRILAAAGWDRDVLEIGCGEGFHAAWLAQQGYRVTAMDAAHEGITNAIRNHGNDNPAYVCADLAEWEPPRQYDGIFCRGMSWFHYRLDANGVADMPAQTRRLFSWLRPGGSFVLQICTNFSGKRPIRGVHHNRLEDYTNLFSPIGHIEEAFDWRWRPLHPPVKVGTRYGINMIVRKS